jgi:type II secretory pathway pseudopilin PulG
MKQTEAGFSYIDTMVGLTVMLIGLLGLAGTIGVSVMRSRQQEQQLLAKQYATSIMESVLSARDIKSANFANNNNTTPIEDGWDFIGHVNTNIVDGTARGIFVIGEKPLSIGAGDDQVIGTADDITSTAQGISQEVIITDICDPERPSANCSPAGANPVMMRNITVKVRYPNNPANYGNARLTEIVSTVLSKY